MVDNVLREKVIILQKAITKTRLKMTINDYFKLAKNKKNMAKMVKTYSKIFKDL